MKLLSTEIGEKGIELLYADNQNTDDAETLLVVRLPFAVDAKKSIAWNRYQALDHLQSLIQKLKTREHPEGR